MYCFAYCSVHFYSLQLSRIFHISEDEAHLVITEEVTKACELAWDIGSLIPPPVIGCPPEYNERLHEYRLKLHMPPCTLQYHRPVLLHGSHGQLAEKGLVSIKGATKPICKFVTAKLRDHDDLPIAFAIFSLVRRFILPTCKLPAKHDCYGIFLCAVL